MSLTMYSKQEVLQLMTLLSDSTVFGNSDNGFSDIDKKEGIKELLKGCKNKVTTEIDINKLLWEILGAGTELHILVVLPIDQVPLIINTYKGTIFDRLVKVRLMMGK